MAQRGETRHMSLSFFFFTDLRFGFDFCQFWVAGDGCRCVSGLELMEFELDFLALYSGSRGLRVGFWLILMGV